MAKPTKPRAGAKLAKLAKPAKPAARAKPAKPAARAKLAKRTARAKPAKRTARAKPAKPAKRAAPAKRAKRAAPKRAAPAERAAPADLTPERGRTAQIATVATERAKLSDPEGCPARDGPVQLGSITVPSGTLAIFDVGLMGYLPREALDPMLICAPVPSDRALPVLGVRVGSGRFAACWDHVAIDLAGAPPGAPQGQPREPAPPTEPGPAGAPGRREIAHARKLGEAAVDFARLICMDRAAIDHWQHEDSLDQLADVVVSGRDEATLAKALGARRLPHGEGHGWLDLPLAEAEAKADRAAELKAEHRWLLTTELRPHSHHARAVTAARASPGGAGVLEVGGARVLLFFTSWGDGVYPVYLDIDHNACPVQIRIQLAPVDAQPPPRPSARPPAR